MSPPSFPPFIVLWWFLWSTITLIYSKLGKTISLKAICMYVGRWSYSGFQWFYQECMPWSTIRGRSHGFEYFLIFLNNAICRCECCRCLSVWSCSDFSIGLLLTTTILSTTMGNKYVHILSEQTSVVCALAHGLESGQNCSASDGGKR